MRQVTVDTVISAPREDVFDLVADLSLRPSFADHYLKDYRLARANPVGKGAAARFLLDTPVFNERGEIAIVECDRPRRIVEEGRVGRVGRSRLLAIYDFIPEAGGSTRVELTTLSDPKTIVDRVRQTGIHVWVRRNTKKSLERLRRIFEEPGDAELTAHHRRRVRAEQGPALRRPRAGGQKSPRGRRVDCPPRGSRPPQKHRRGMRRDALGGGGDRGVWQQGRGAGRGGAGPRGPGDRRGGRGLQRLPHPPAQPRDPARQRLLRG